MNRDDVDIFVEKNEDGHWIARILHRPSGTIKISNLFPTRDQAIADASEGFIELLTERLKGFGKS